MGRFEELESCAELTSEHAVEAAASAASMRAFLDWAVGAARPEEGAPKILLAIGKLAEANWVDGTLYIDIAGDDSITKISIFADYGFGIRERLLPLARLSVPFDEFVRASRIGSKLFAPLHAELLAGSLVLTPPDANLDSLDGESLEGIAIAESSMVDDPLKMLDDPLAGLEDPNRTRPPPAVGLEEMTPLAPPAVTKPPPPDAAVTKPPPSIPEQSGIHTHPTVRRMVAVRPEALRSGNDD